MRVSWIWGASLCTLSGFALAQQSADGCDVAGQWRTQMHGAKVKVRECAQGRACGVLVWVDPAISAGVTTDERNPDPALRSRPLLGLPLMWGFQCKNGRLDSGRVYNPDTGQTFRASVRKAAADRLNVTGCLGPFCLTEVWTRVASD